MRRLVVALGGVRARKRPRSSRRLSLEEREEIRAGLQAGASFAALARRIGRCPSTVSREVNLNGGRRRYRAVAADGAAYRRALRPKPAKLVQNERLRRRVEELLEERWSPQQIAARLRREFPDDPGMQVSHETIYQSLFVQARGALRRDLAKCLRTGRARRRIRGRPGRRGELRDIVVISERPAEVADRAVPGHWEGDLIMGAGNRSAIVTLVERQTRYLLLARIGTDKTSPAVCEAIARKILELPDQLARSLTWDRGREMAGHREFSVKSGLPVYFCDPHSPWQRGSNENTNGLLRQYFPKSTDLAIHSQAELDRVATQLNGRPRQTLNWDTPTERLNQLIAMTA
ncbi:MAG TPA: IS30 family transposase [Thermoleophilaceae bacterium]|nr:IS30 family transposase [Thermoleophilaceae bacterium]